MKRPRTPNGRAVQPIVQDGAKTSRAMLHVKDLDARDADMENGSLDDGHASSCDEADAEASKLSDEEAESRANDLVENTIDFAALRGIGEPVSGDDDDSETELEVMALADLPSQVIKTHKNDEPALDRKLAEIARFDTAKPHGDGRLPFRESLSIVMLMDEALPAELANDDLKREERFAEIATESVHLGLARLRQMKIKFRRPSDYFAEMAKSDKHMTKVKARMLHEKERIDNAQKNRNNRDIRKNKKKTRQAQLEREQGKKQKANQEISAVKLMNKKRIRDRATGANGGDDDDFPIDLLDIEEMRGGTQQFVKAPARPKANVGRKGDSAIVGADGGTRKAVNRPTERSKVRDVPSEPRGTGAGRTRGGRGPATESRGIRKPSIKLGSKKRPGKSRRVKSNGPGRR
jgi:hypothetical protein